MLFRAGVADWRRRAHSLPCRYRDPDRRTDAHLLAFDGKGLGQAQDDRIGDSRQLFGLAHLRHDDLELVAAEAPGLSLVADDLRQTPRDRSDERRVGTEFVNTCSSRLLPTT